MTAQLTYSPEVESSVVGAMLARPKIIGEVIGTTLQPEHFYSRAHREVFDKLVDAYYTDGATDPLSIAERCGARLMEAWRCSMPECAEKLKVLATHQAPQNGIAHARLVKRDYDWRALRDIAGETLEQIGDRVPPEELAAQMSQRAMQVATGTILSNEIISYGDLGRRFVQRQRELRAAKAAGIEIGAFFGMKFLDDRIHGLKPGELWILGGEPGAGKSGVAFCSARDFAIRQMQKPEDKRIGTFVLSLEMGEEPSSDRYGQSEGHVDGAKLRDGTSSNDELARIIKNWGGKKDLPLYFNFTSMIRASQLRALVVEAIRRYNVGLIFIDHMRYFDADRRRDNAHDEDEEKARFLKEQIAKDLNVAVCLLAHTTKSVDGVEDRRPRLSHLRGGGMVAAHADFVSFMYRPAMHATEEDILTGTIRDTDAELIWAKNRHGANDRSLFHFDPSIMLTRDTI